MHSENSPMRWTGKREVIGTCQDEGSGKIRVCNKHGTYTVCYFLMMVTRTLTHFEG